MRRTRKIKSSSLKMEKKPLKGELRGIVTVMKEFKSEPMFPLFEAIVNSIQGIEERFGDTIHTDGEIRVEVRRKTNPQMEFSALGIRKEYPIVSFAVIDNGIGFTQKNLDSFETVASAYKIDKGCKGMGRFTWLKAFDRVHIVSVYEEEDGKRYKRIIDFSLQDQLQVAPQEETTDEVKTTVELLDFKPSYSGLPNALKTSKKIVQRTLEHTLSYFLKHKNPKMVFSDPSSSEGGEFDLQEIFNGWERDITSESLVVGDERFDLYHLKLYDTLATMHQIVLCGNGRDVKSLSINKLLGTSVQFDENDRRFTYAAYLYGCYLDKHVDVSRTDFDLPEESAPMDTLAPIGKNEIVNAVMKRTKSLLGECIKKVNARKTQKVHEYVANKNPALRSTLHYCPEAMNEIDVDDSESKIDEILYGFKGKAEYEMRERGRTILKTSEEGTSVSIEKAEKLCREIEDYQKDTLASYVIFRKLIIDLLDERIKVTVGGSSEKENVVHDIFFPRRTEAGEIDYQEHNLWLLDDRLAFHSEATSDLRLGKGSSKVNSDRPDVLLFADVDQTTLTARSVTVLEFKRPQRKNYTESPISQMIRMVRDLKQLKVKRFANGRELHISPETTQFYCYGLFDMTQQVIDFADDNDYSKLPDGLGYYNYHSTLHASIYMFDYDKIVTDARKRNYAMFEKLGIPTFEPLKENQETSSNKSDIG